MKEIFKKLIFIFPFDEVPYTEQLKLILTTRLIGRTTAEIIENEMADDFIALLRLICLNHRAYFWELKFSNLRIFIFLRN